MQRTENASQERMVEMYLSEIKPGKDVLVKNIDSDDEELKSFLFSLGCYSGERITLVACRRGGVTLAVKDARYNIDTELARKIEICHV